MKDKIKRIVAFLLLAVACLTAPSTRNSEQEDRNRETESLSIGRISRVVGT